jgi:hypothetical protein
MASTEFVATRPGAQQVANLYNGSNYAPFAHRPLQRCNPASQIATRTGTCDDYAWRPGCGRLVADAHRREKAIYSLAWERMWERRAVGRHSPSEVGRSPSPPSFLGGCESRPYLISCEIRAASPYQQPKDTCRNSGRGWMIRGDRQRILGRENAGCAEMR